MQGTDPHQSARVNRKVLITDPEAAFSMQQRQAEALADMMGAESSRIDSLVKDMGAVRGTVEVVHSQVNDVKAGVDKLSDALEVMVRHELTMEHTAAAVRGMAEQQGKLSDRLHTLEVKAPGWDELRVWVIRAGLGVLGVVGMAMLLLVMKNGAGA